MNCRSGPFFAASVFFVCTLATSVQSQPGVYDLSEWLVEVRRADQSVSYFGPLGRVTSRMNFLPALGEEEEGGLRKNLRSVKLESSPEGDLIALRVFISRLPEILEVPPDAWLEVGSHLLRPGQRIELGELEAFGMAAVELRMVPRTPEQPLPFEFVNDVPSIEVVEREESRHEIALTLFNDSERNIYAMHFADRRDGDHASLSGHIGTLDTPLLAAGEQKKFRFSVPRNKGQLVSEWKSILTSVVYDDGSFEGDARIAFETLAQRFGMRRYQEILCSYLNKQPYLLKDGADPLESLQSLAEQFELLEQKTVAQAEDFLKEFPEFREAASEDLDIYLRRGVKSQAEGAIHFILQSNSSPPLQDRLPEHPEIAQRLFDSLQDGCPIN